MLTRLCAAALLLPCLLATACRNDPGTVDPSIDFTTIPEAAIGGPDRLAPVGGRVAGVRPGQRVVLYTKTNVWWVQPLTSQPFTTVASDSTWRNTIHLGTEYAALLVEPGYRPPDTIEGLPRRGGGVIAVATVKGTGDFATRAPKVLAFSGYEWNVREIPSDRGGANEYDRANAWIDADGSMHLKLAQRAGRWTSAEVILTRSLGHGTYVFTVRDISDLDPAAAVGLLTWDEQGVEQNHRELDIELSQWGDAKIPNAQYVVQPFYVPANVARFTAPHGALTHSIRWEPGRAVFMTVRGRRAGEGSRVARREFTSGVPTPGTERVRMNLYFFRFAPAPPQKDVEVVIERFQYLP